MANESVNAIDLSQYKELAKTYILKKAMVMAENYTVEDVLIVGLRKLAREKVWQEKYGNTNSNKEKMEKLKSAIIQLGGDPEEYLAKM